MKLKLVSLISAVYLSQGLALHASTRNLDLNGMVANKCSGAIVDIGRQEHEYAVILTNGHCTKQTALPPEVFVQNEQYIRSDISVFNNQNKAIPVQPRNVLYGTMEGGDLGLIEVFQTYTQLRALGVKVFKLAAQNSEPNAELFTASGFWQASQACLFTHNVPLLIEGNYKWPNAMAMAENCKFKGGWSGSPLISKTSGQIVGVFNTANESGARCTLNNPCENYRGNISVAKGRGYGIHTAVIWSCVTNGQVVLNKPGCKLFNQKKLKNPADERLSPAQKLEWLKRLTQEYPSKQIDIQVVNYDMTHMSTSLANKIYVNNAILSNYSVLELLFYACHELGHHFGDKRITASPDLAVEAEADYFAGSCLSEFSLKWENQLRPYINLYQASNYPRCGRDGLCNKSVEIINHSFSILLGDSIVPDKAIGDRFPNGINLTYPEANCRALSAVSGLIGAARPTCWYNPR